MAIPLSGHSHPLDGSFPEELRAAISHSPSKAVASRKLEEIFKDPKVREQFFCWVDQHEGMVNHNPTLRKIYRYVENVELERYTGDAVADGLVNLVDTVKSVAAYLNLNGSEKDSFQFKLDQWLNAWIPDLYIESCAYRLSNSPSSSFKILLAYLEAGLVTSDQVAELIIKGFGKNAYWASKSFREGAEAPLLLLMQNLKPTQLAKIFKSTPIIHYYGNNDNFVELLINLPSDQLFEALKFQDRDDRTPLHIFKFKDTFVNLLNKMSDDQLFELLKIKDEDGKGTIELFGNNPKFIEILNKLSPEHLSKLIFEEFKDDGDKFLEVLGKLSPDQIFGVLKFEDEETLLDLLGWLSSEQLLKILKYGSKGKKEPFDPLGDTNQFLVVLSRLSPDQIFELLKLEDEDKLLELLGKLPPDQIFKLLKYVRTWKNKPYSLGNPDKFLGLLSKLSPDQIFTVLNLEGADTLLKLLKTLSPDQLFKVLKYGSEKKEEPFDPLGDTNQFLVLLSKLSPDQLSEVLPIDDIGEYVELLSRLSADQLFVILSVARDSENNTLLHLVPNKQVINLLSRLPVEHQIALLKIKNINGRIPIYHPDWYVYAKNTFPPPVFREMIFTKDKEGINAYVYHQFKPSLSWLTASKVSPEAASISKQEYLDKASYISEYIQMMWADIPFGVGEKRVNPTQFAQTPEAINEALTVVMNKINTKLAWLGTPPAEKVDDLHQFYSEIVIDLEIVVAFLKKEKDPTTIAGTLERIALAEIEGRCATAYKDEIEQVRFLMEMQESNSGDSFKTIVDKILNRTLGIVISQVASKKYESDVHESSQMKYAMGLSAVPDYLCKTEIDVLQEDVINEWTVDNVSNIAMPFLQRLDNEMLSRYFEEATPADYRPAGKLLDTAQMFEAEQLNRLREQLAADGLNEDQIRKISNFVILPSGASLRYKEVSASLLEKINSLNEADRAIVNSATSFNVIEDVFRRNALMPTVAEKTPFITDIKRVANNNALKAALLSNFGVLPENVEKVMKAKASFDKAIDDWAKEAEIEFNPNHGNLARAIEDGRRQAFQAECFDAESGQLNKFGALLLIEKEGAMVRG